MEIYFTPSDSDMEAWLSNTAAREGVDAETILREAVLARMNYDAWFVGEVQRGINDISQGRVVEHETAKAHFAELRQRQPKAC